MTDQGVTKPAKLANLSGSDKAGGLCPGCAAQVELSAVRTQGAWERTGCLSCGLQLLRKRSTLEWSEIRG
jgi:hypothetical protein